MSHRLTHSPQFAKAFIFTIPWAQFLAESITSLEHVTTTIVTVEVPLDGQLDDLALRALAVGRVVMPSYWLTLCDQEGLALTMELQPQVGTAWTPLSLDETVAAFRQRLPRGVAFPLCVAILSKPPVLSPQRAVSQAIDQLQQRPLAIRQSKVTHALQKISRAEVTVLRQQNVAKYEADRKHRHLQAVLKCHATEDNRLMDLKALPSTNVEL